MLLLFVLASVSLVINADDCPRLPCPFTGFCKETTPTYFEHNGMRCRGCDQCVFDHSDAPKLSQTVTLNMCPMVMCMNPGKCPVAYTYSTFKVGSLNCTGCPSCPTGNHPDGSISLKRQLQAIHFNMCPMVMCASPGPCDVALQTSTLTLHGRTCPGCAFCPTTATTTT